MNRPVGPEVIAAPIDTGLRAVVGIAGYYRTPPTRISSSANWR